MKNTKNKAGKRAPHRRSVHAILIEIFVLASLATSLVKIFAMEISAAVEVVHHLK